MSCAAGGFASTSPSSGRAASPRPVGSVRRPRWSPPRRRRHRAPPPLRWHRRAFPRQAAAVARSGRRAPRRSHPERCGPRSTPSRSRPHRAGRPHRESGDRPARAVPRCRCRSAKRGAPAPRSAAHASPTADGPRRYWRARADRCSDQQQAAVVPRRQRRIHQATGGVEHREVHCGARGVQVAHQFAQPVWQRLLARIAASAAADMSRPRAV